MAEEKTFRNFSGINAGGGLNNTLHNSGTYVKHAATRQSIKRLSR